MSAALPTIAELSGDDASDAQAWRLFGVRQTGKLDISNERTPDALDIIAGCEARDLAAARQLQIPAWQFWRR